MNIPIVDLSLMNGKIDEIANLADVITHSYTNIGFSYIINHGIESNLINDIMNVSREFYALPLESKLKIKRNEFFRGYYPLNSSINNISTMGRSYYPNWNESFVIGHEINNSKISNPLSGPNQWLYDVPNFKEVVINYEGKIKAGSFCLKIITT